MAVTAGLLRRAAAVVVQAKTVGVSWRHFQEERWKIDEAGIKEAWAKAGYDYVGGDAQADQQKQLTDIEAIARKVDALIILAQDSAAILRAFEKAKAEGIPTIAYDVPVDFAERYSSASTMSRWGA